MKKWSVIIGIIVLLAASGSSLVYLLFSEKTDKQPKPDILVPSASATVTSTMLPSPTVVFTASPTATATITPSPTPTATLAIRVAVATLVMPDVTLPTIATPLSENLQILADVPDPVEPLPNATSLPWPYTDFTNWAAFESDHPAVRYVTGTWMPIRSHQASQGQYHFTEDTNADITFTFTGEAVRVRYVGFTNGGVWNVLLDGLIVDVIDAYAPVATFTGTRVYALGAGEHTLELQNTGNANPASNGHMLALDAVQVYRPDAQTLILADGALPTATATPTLIPASSIELLAAPPSPQPTATEIPIQVVSVSIVMGYDENANGVLDVSEGVRGISVRLVEVGTNNVLAHTFTDERGFAQLQASTNSPVLLVVPYFGESWTVQSHGLGTAQTFTLLLSPGNQPGLIP
ncbi:MAG: hypothetical protein BroJett018_21940 [Chloroflexota bacterium]|nr:hypothetical protein [Chloroflexota bacterium]GIK64400.1 MAG: hypothetical protein BroJett018_21940 [Chloroflexota bacterium]